MYSLIYILIAVIVALSAGVWIYRQNKSNDSFDYVPAIAAGFLWPISVMLFATIKFLDIFKDVCIQISNDMDEAEKKRLEKEAAKSKEP